MVSKESNGGTLFPCSSTRLMSMLGAWGHTEQTFILTSRPLCVCLCWCVCARVCECREMIYDTLQGEIQYYIIWVYRSWQSSAASDYLLIGCPRQQSWSRGNLCCCQPIYSVFSISDHHTHAHAHCVHMLLRVGK